MKPDKKLAALYIKTSQLHWALEDGGDWDQVCQLLIDRSELSGADCSRILHTLVVRHINADRLAVQALLSSLVFWAAQQQSTNKERLQ